MREVWIVSAARTPVGSFNGFLSTVTAAELGAIAIKAALERGKVPFDAVDEVIMGCVIPAAQGQAPARQALRGAGLADSVGATTINKVCGSGLKAVGLAVQAIQCNDADVIVAGGMENMSLGPHALTKSRFGYRMGNITVLDLMLWDGLWDAYEHVPMGQFADRCAKEEGISREDLDAFSADSYRRALDSIERGAFRDEIIAVEVKGRKGKVTVVEDDEEPGRVKFEKIPQLKPAFSPDGVVTAANASSINDGAAAIVVIAADKARELGLEPMVRVIAQATDSKEPFNFPRAPVGSIEKVLAKSGWTHDQVDLYEINQAFAVVSLYTQRKLGLDPSKIDVFGGAVAIGHPIGASGARVLTTLLHGMGRVEAKRGLASLCIGGGEAFAMTFEKV
ncbi:MAG: acetyl-CoA C-acyltransferase [Candidatus Alcyoniella australis]|nr:acetyl-CoA C-acyltransferase [Candidatus Alcyoniella australis]